GATPRTKIRLAYKALVTGKPPTQSEGMVIDPPQPLSGKLLDHFQEIANVMRLCHRVTDETEATGEAAAACAMAFGSTYPGCVMLWGFDTHSGAGIDQIWGHRTLAGTYDYYVIVEAKGVGQVLSVDNTTPGTVGQQMSHD